MGIWKTAEEMYVFKSILPSLSFKCRLTGLNPSAVVIAEILNLRDDTIQQQNYESRPLKDIFTAVNIKSRYENESCHLSH